jgi:hypothetical protein
MKRCVLAAVMAAGVVPMCCLAQSAFDGTWKIDANQIHLSDKPDVLVVKNGMYQCKTCVPPVDIKADGTDQPVKGHPYFDTMAIKLVDAHTLQETDKRGGKVVATSTTTLSADGNQANFEFSDSSAGDGQAVTGKGVMTRVGKAPADGSGFSGSWKTQKLDSISDNAMRMTFKKDGDMLSMNTPTGMSYSAKLGGADAPFKGDPGVTTVSVKQMGERHIVETDKRNGKVVTISDMTVMPDGKSMDVKIQDKLRDRTMSFIALKQ